VVFEVWQVLGRDGDGWKGVDRHRGAGRPRGERCHTTGRAAPHPAVRWSRSRGQSGNSHLSKSFFGTRALRRSRSKPTNVPMLCRQ